jgi:quinol monooxygenase YgiN
MNQIGAPMMDRPQVPGTPVMFVCGDDLAAKQTTVALISELNFEVVDVGDYCLGYQLTRCEEEPDRFILRILWTSTDDHLNGFRPSAQFRSFFPPIRPYVNDIEEMQHYAVVEGLDSGPNAASRRAT